MQAPFPVLILGGTTEAMRLADLLAGDANYAAVMSFAGRTRDVRPPSIPHRVGGFGGPDGLARYLREHGVSAVVDATHPFAARMSANAGMACAAEHIPLVVYTRPPWRAADGDRWIEVDDFSGAACALGDTAKTVFLAVGRQEIGAFRDGAAHHYVVRSVDPPDAQLMPAGARLITARGPFTLDEEVALLREVGADVVVSKNSGGNATYGKIAAARQLGLPVIMIRRPRPAAEGELHEAAAVLAWLDALRRTHGGSP